MAIYRPVPSPILQVVSANHRRGAEIYAVDLRDELRRRGRRMELVALRPSPGPATLDVPVLGRSRFGGQRALRRLARHSRGVIAHGSDTLLAASAATVGSAVPFVYRSIGDPAFWSGRPTRRIRVAAQLRRAAAVAVTHQRAADVLVGSYGLRADRVTVIANGRPLDRFPEPDDDERRHARTALLGDLDGPVVAFIGALSHEKGADRAVQTIAQLAGTHLLVAGDGPLRPMLEDYANAIAPDRVHFLGTRPDVRQVYLAADAALITSRSEGFPGVAIEAALSAIPVVATNVGAVPEVVQDGVTGFVVDAVAPGALADAVRVACERSTTLGRDARQHAVAHFDLAVVADAWDTLLSRVFAPEDAP